MLYFFPNYVKPYHFVAFFILISCPVFSILWVSQLICTFIITHVPRRIVDLSRSLNSNTTHLKWLPKVNLKPYASFNCWGTPSVPSVGVEPGMSGSEARAPRVVKRTRHLFIKDDPRVGDTNSISEAGSGSYVLEIASGYNIGRMAFTCASKVILIAFCF